MNPFKKFLIAQNAYQPSGVQTVTAIRVLGLGYIVWQVSSLIFALATGKVGGELVAPIIVACILLSIGAIWLGFGVWKQFISGRKKENEQVQAVEVVK